ncbi:hypothetical protein CR513_13235, partial [Mucuna pruriens]
MPITRNQTSSTNEGEEDTLQRFLHAVASLQACSDEQPRFSVEAEQRQAKAEQRQAKAEQRQAEAEERHRQAEECHLEAMRMAEQREEELRQQIVALKAADRRELATREGTAVQAFWKQSFCEEIDKTLIPPNFKEIVDLHAHLQTFQIQMSEGNDRFSCKLFPGILRGVAMYWMATLPARSIQTFNDLAGSFVSQFAANKVKKLEVIDLFDIKQSRGESLKSYLARFNNATVRVDDLDQKFFVKAFQKGLRAGPFSDTLALRRLSSMEEIRARAKKYVEVEEDQAKRLEVERVYGHEDSKWPAQCQAQATKRQVQKWGRDFMQHFTPLTEKRAQILREICHTSLLEFPLEVKGQIMGKSREDWCDFHRSFGHSTEGCWMLKTQLEKLIQEGHLG